MGIFLEITPFPVWILFCSDRSDLLSGMTFGNIDSHRIATDEVFEALRKSVGCIAEVFELVLRWC
jgi:hypothetical protein